ncbi:MAG: serine/threonine protein kinase [Myxococcales bacterium]|nr:serine/threonine protein kinase [Myxococcales bacterium]
MDARELELLRPLGQGGFGTVWLARLHGRDGFTRRVAVKLMKDGSATADIVARQRDEARLLGMLQHPHIVQVFDLTEHNGLPAVVMEFVEGADLASVIKHRGPLPLGAALEVGIAVAGALDAGWTAVAPDTGRPLRVIHRDIKPANVLVTVHGAVKVLDFGVARADFDREGHTQSMAFGTPRFMAPEQFLGGELSAANDVYALAVTLFEISVGTVWERPPLAEGRFNTKVRAQLNGAAPVLHSLLTRMTAWEPAARPTAAEVGQALEALHVPGESLRSWAAGAVSGVMARHALGLSASGSSAVTTPPASLGSALVSLSAALPAPAEADDDSGASLGQVGVQSEAPRSPMVWFAAMAAGLALVVGAALLGGVGWWLSQEHAPPESTTNAEAPPPAVAGEPGRSAEPANAIVGPPDVAATPAPLPAQSSEEPIARTRPRSPRDEGPSGAELVAELQPESAPTRAGPGPTKVRAPAQVAAVPAPVAPVVVVATPPAEAARKRSLRILADVIGASVLIDGVGVGQTPLAARPLTYGDHLIEVVVDGRSARHTIMVDGNSAGVLRYRSREKKWVWE